jgi:U3 small nucleolar RNA-associated protein 21
MAKLGKRNRDSSEEGHYLSFSDDENNEVGKTSVLLEPFKVLGYYASEVPFKIYHDNGDRLMLIAVGYSFHIYNLEHLRIVFMSHVLVQRIKAVAVHKDCQYTGLDNNNVIMWNKLRRIVVFKGASQPISAIKVMGSHLMQLGSSGELLVWSIESKQMVKRMDIGKDMNAMVHPHTYMNKMLFVGNQRVCLMNVDTEKLIYEFRGLQLDGKVVCVE